MSPHHQRRQGDPPPPGWRLWLWRFERVWQDAVPLFAIIVAFIAVLGVEDKIDKVDAFQTQQIEGRRIAIDVLCGGVYGVEVAGRAIITQRLPDGRRFPGAPPGPPSREERMMRRNAARIYSKIISEAVIAQVGPQNGVDWEPEDLLNRDGTVDCEAVQVVSRAMPGLAVDLP